jgi:hypothetical protein
LCLEIFFEDFKPRQKLEVGNSKLFHGISLVKPQGKKGNHKFPAVAGFLCDKSVVKSAVLINTIIGALQLFYKNMFYIFSSSSFPFIFDFLDNGYNRALVVMNGTEQNGIKIIAK